MRRIALVQNQSEMAHYSHADARPVLAHLNYQVTLYTATNIDDLEFQLSRNMFDSIIFGSNSFNDSTILAVTSGAKFQNALALFLESGNGLICFMQYGVANLKGALPFEMVVAPKPQMRPTSERATAGDLRRVVNISQTAATLLSYPEKVNVPSIAQHSVEHKSLPGLYWHYWADASPDIWDDVLVARSADRELDRSVLLASKGTTKGRIVLCSLPLDWHGYRPLIRNLVSYVTEGHEFCAVLEQANLYDFAFDYLKSTLSSQQYPFRVYHAGSDDAELTRNINERTHSLLIFGPRVERDSLMQELSNEIADAIGHGHLKTLDFVGLGRKTPVFSIVGRERFAQRTLEGLKALVAQQLQSGYVDGSFWATIETLNALQEVQFGISTDQLRKSRALELTRTHDRDGSYDEVFGITCALVWLRARVYGLSNPDTEKSLAWLRARIRRYNRQEQLSALITLHRLSSITDEEINEAKALVPTVLCAGPSEVELVSLLTAAIEFKLFELVETITDDIHAKVVEGMLLDLSTTASLVFALVKTLRTDLIRSAENGSYLGSRQRTDIQTMLKDAVLAIQTEYKRARIGSETPAVPWDGKLSTSVKCATAWVLFDDLVDFPLYECVAFLDSEYADRREGIALNSLHQSVVQLSEMYQQRGSEINELKGRLSDDRKEHRTLVRRAVLAWGIVGLLGYILLTEIIVYVSLEQKTRDALVSKLPEAIFSGPLLLVVLALFTVPWRDHVGLLVRRLGRAPSDSSDSAD